MQETVDFHFDYNSSSPDNYGKVIENNPQLTEIAASFFRERNGKAEQNGITEAEVKKHTGVTLIPPEAVNEQIIVRYLEVQAAMQALIQLAPSLQDTIQSVNGNLLIGLGPSYGYGRINSTHVLSLPLPEKNSPTRGTLNEISLCLHELLHAVVYEQLGIQDYQLDHSPTLAERLYKALSIWRVLTEGISMAFQLEFMKKSIQSSKNKQETEILKNHLAQRLKAYSHQRETDIYALGYQIARILQSNGWELDDLPLLLKNLEAFVQKKAVKVTVLGKEYSGTDALRVMPAREAGPNAINTPLFEELLQEIKGLKKDTFHSV
jgi:hypothetical protein